MIIYKFLRIMWYQELGLRSLLFIDMEGIHFRETRRFFHLSLVLPF